MVGWEKAGVVRRWGKRERKGHTLVILKEEEVVVLRFGWEEEEEDVG